MELESREEYEARMKEFLEEKGLYAAVDHICDKINSLASLMRYVHHREVQECLCDILYLCELSQGNNVSDISVGKKENNNDT